MIREWFGEHDWNIRALAVVLGPDGAPHVVGTVQGRLEADTPGNDDADVYVVSWSPGGEPASSGQLPGEGSEFPIYAGVHDRDLVVVGTVERDEWSAEVFFARRGLDGRDGPTWRWSEGARARAIAAAVAPRAPPSRWSSRRAPSTAPRPCFAGIRELRGRR